MFPELIEDFKGKINNLLWVNLPSEITIGQADKLAMALFETYEKISSEIIKENNREVL